MIPVLLMAKCTGVPPRKKLGKNKDSGVRNIRHRILPRTHKCYHEMVRLVEVCKILWNLIWFQQRCEYHRFGHDPNWKPKHDRTDMNRRFTELKRLSQFAWLKEDSAGCIREGLYDQGKAWTEYELT